MRNLALKKEWNLRKCITFLNMPQRWHLSIEDRARAIGRLNEGVLQREAARRLYVSPSVINRLCQRLFCQLIFVNKSVFPNFFWVVYFGAWLVNCLRYCTSKQRCLDLSPLVTECKETLKKKTNFFTYVSLLDYVTPIF